MLKRPESNEYAAYYSSYVNRVPDGNIINLLENQLNKWIYSLKDLTEEQGRFRYGLDKWTIKEVIGHIADTERIMGYRMLCIARGETIPLPGYDDISYVQNAEFNRLSLQELLDNLMIVRQSTISLLKILPSDSWGRQGNANGAGVTVRGIAYIIAGHELHHCQILQDQYLSSADFPAE
ncbi:DinB family protein [Bacillus sp. S/N-304-OC-R1]|uniref:DinB family protein n=1 Tax=Bacillus sp. S/N-304-OC-R1 TaxID=2758034 RepID=UPI001C8E7E15|nr:DinB family protein [Bacillus sp. S/N-304-OC-R1]MBY0123034.1 DinB family protein [Bacillus sp. S/N-304-OC-R1]